MNKKETTKEEKAVTVKLQDYVTVEFNEKAAFHKAGTQKVVHSFLANKFVEKGVAKIV